MEEKEKKPRKPKTKIAAAKKLLNKNVKINTKIVFGDDGEVRYKLFSTLCIFFLLSHFLVPVVQLKQML